MKLQQNSAGLQLLREDQKILSVMLELHVALLPDETLTLAEDCILPIDLWRSFDLLLWGQGIKNIDFFMKNNR